MGAGMEEKVSKPFRMQVEVPMFFRIAAPEQWLADVVKDNWVGLYYLPMWLGNDPFVPKAEDLTPQAPDMNNVPVSGLTMRVSPAKVGHITRFFLEEDRLFVEGEITDSRIDFSNPNWGCKLWSTPRFNNPRDHVTHVRFELLGGALGDVHGLDPEIMEGVA